MLGLKDLDYIMSQLSEMGTEQNKKIYKNHGAIEPLFGVSVANLKILQKQIKKNHELALALYKTGNSDAMYLAGLIADETKISKNDLQYWAEHAPYYMISEYTVPWVASESKYGLEMAKLWINSPFELIASAGWNTLSNILSITDNSKIDWDDMLNLTDRIKNTIHQSQNRVRYCMNGFLIAVGGYNINFKNDMFKIADDIGNIHVEMGNTACRVPDLKTYIEKMHLRNMHMKKKKTSRC